MRCFGANRSLSPEEPSETTNVASENGRIASPLSKALNFNADCRKIGTTNRKPARNTDRTVYVEIPERNLPLLKIRGRSSGISPRRSRRYCQWMNTTTRVTPSATSSGVGDSPAGLNWTSAMLNGRRAVHHPYWPANRKPVTIVPRLRIDNSVPIQSSVAPFSAVTSSSGRRFQSRERHRHPSPGGRRGLLESCRSPLHRQRTPHH